MRKTQMKKLASILLVVAMLFTMASPVMAANDYSITVSNANDVVSIDGNTYSAYKVFHATYNTETKTIAYSYTDDCIPVSYDHDKNEETAALSGQTLLEWLGQSQDKRLMRTDAEVRAFADYVYENYIQNKEVTAAGSATAVGESVTIPLAEAGYYLVYGTGNTYDNESQITASVSLTSTQPNATVNPKFDAPTLDKKIWHNDLANWDVVGDNQVGDTVKFQIATLVPNTNGYDEYEYIIHDTMSDGLTSNVTNDDNSIDVHVFRNGSATKLDGEYYTVTANGNTFTVDIEIINAMEDGVLQVADTIHVEYTAVLNANAHIYDQGKEKNTAYLEYSNNPYTNSKGETTKVTVYDWTFKLNVNKTDAAGNALNGAVFALSTAPNLELDADNDGVLDSTTSLIGLVKETDGVYRVADGATDTSGKAIVYTIDAGSAIIKGLDDVVDYYLYEIKAPDGYNKITEPVHFKILANYITDGSALAQHSPSVVVNSGQPSTDMKVDVINNSGTTLPTTGGMGTTVFYALGGALVLGAVVLLVTRKRMGVE